MAYIEVARLYLVGYAAPLHAEFSIQSFTRKFTLVTTELGSPIWFGPQTAETLVEHRMEERVKLQKPR